MAHIRPRTLLRSVAAPQRSGGVLVVLLVVAALAAGAWQLGLFDNLLTKKEVAKVEGAPVRRGPLRISEVVRGNLEAKDSASIRCEVQGRSTIIFLEEEGSMLEEGQLVCELDVSELQDNLVRQEIEVKNAEANFTKAREQYDIQVIQNESDLAAAELALELAKLDLRKYVGEPEAVAEEGSDQQSAEEPAETPAVEPEMPLDEIGRAEPTRGGGRAALATLQTEGEPLAESGATPLGGEVDDEELTPDEAAAAAIAAVEAQPFGQGEWANELASAEENVTLREEDLARALKDLAWSEELFVEGFVQQNELEADVLAKKRAEIQLQQARRERELLVRYGNRRKLAELDADVATCERDIEKTRKQASARLADFEAARESAKYTLDRERQRLTELQQQISKSKIFAPVGGLLVYARERSRWGDGDVIAEGQEVRERQEIAQIPRAGGMTVQASIHETKLKKVKVGQLCQVVVDAFPDRLFDGRVDFVAVMADSGSWRSNPNQRLYKADIALLNPTNDMRPGMSASVEIMIDDLKDVHYVPRQCVFLDGDETIAFVVKDGIVERRSVKVGLDNNKWVSVDEGLKEGETVALAPPADFQPRPSSQPVNENENEGEGEGDGPMGARGQQGGAPGGGQGARPSRGAGGPPGASAGGARPSGAGGGGKPSGGAGARPTDGTGRPAGADSTGGAEGSSKGGSGE